MGRKKRLLRAERKKQDQESTGEAEFSVNLDFDFDERKYNASNAMVLPSKKSAPEMITKVEKAKKKTLSKKQLKKLQCVVQRRQKKANTSKVMEEYSRFQVSAQELAAMTSISSIQTKGLKRMREDAKRKRADVENERSDVSETEDLERNSVHSSSDLDDSNDEQRESQFPIVTPEVFNLNRAFEIEAIEEPQNLDVKIDQSDRKTIFVPVNRDPAIEEWRKSLPVYSEEQSIMEAVLYNDVVVVCGETGSGKTTQIPQFLYEAGFAQEKLICITEPRRVAAMAMSQRVGHEMNVSSKVVSYHIRYENNVTSDTKIKFATDGVLLREIQEDFLLSSYSVIVIDEAHERSVFSDVLVGLLSRIVPLRSKKKDPLKLIIMSATLRVDDFVGNRKLFKNPPPVIKVETRQYPVTIKFLKHTPDNYVNAAFEKVCQIHRTQPAGGILVFVTGRNQVNVLCRKLQAKYPSEQCLKWEKSSTKPNNAKSKNLQVSKQIPLLEMDDVFADNEDKWHDSSDSDSDLSVDDEELFDQSSCNEPVYCLPLFSQLPKHRQNAVFDGAPLDHRLVVIATNVAETSLTIPGIKYVIDTGKVKTKVYDKTTGVSGFIVTWCSKASAEQRAGRAGRTCPGTCYRLYSSAIFNHEFTAFSEPEILTKPIDDLVLQMKSLNVANVVNFPFPTCPDVESIEASEKRLLMMGALQEMKTTLTTQQKKCNRLTGLGRAMSRFPVSPRYSKMLAMAHIDLLSHVIAIISGLTVQEIFLSYNENQNSPKNKWSEIKRKWTGLGNEHLLGDMMIILKAIGASEYMSAKADFHQKIGLRHKAMVEVHKLRRQILGEVCRVFGCDRDQFPSEMNPPSDFDAKCLRKLSLASFFDQVARRIPDESGSRKMKHSYQSIQVEDPIYIDHSSILKETYPEFVVYQEIHEEDSKMYMRNIAAIEPEWLPVFAPNLCNLSDPLDEPPPFYDNERDTVMCYVTGTFGPHCWQFPQTAIQYDTNDGQHIKWFAKLLLEGHIHPFFSTYSTKLLTPASLVVKPWAKLQSRANGITSRLFNDKIASLRSLNKKWTSDPQYLLDEYLNWLPQTLHDRVRKNWPPGQEV